MEQAVGRPLLQQCVCVLLTLTAILCTMTLGSVSTITLHAQRGGEEEVNYGAQKNYKNEALLCKTLGALH